MTTFTFNNTTDNPGYLNDKLTYKDAKRIADELNLVEQQITGTCFTNDDESILIEPDYGISFTISQKDIVTQTLLKLDFSTL
jgi:hypothetical protein